MIVIPSAGRAGRVKTLAWMTPDFLVVKRRERDDYERAYPDIPILPVPNRIDTAGKVRQYLIQELAINHVQVDDDLSFSPLDKTATAKELLDWVMSETKNFSLTAIGRQFMSNVIVREKGWIVYDKPGYEVLGINYEDMRDAAVGRFTLMNDIALNIHAMLRRGTAVNYRGITSNASMKIGGCSVTRTPATVSECQQLLLNRWPEFVKVLDRPPKKDGGRGVDVETSLRVSWVRLAKARNERENASQ